MEADTPKADIAFKDLKKTLSTVAVLAAPLPREPYSTSW
jgi:hypothetical protein